MQFRVLCMAFLTSLAILPAKAEVTTCMAITSLPAVITTPGIHCLKSNLSFQASTGRAIDIRSSPVTLDLNGFWINNFLAGAGTAAIGIASTNRKDITIRNGTVRGFFIGVQMDGAAAMGGIIEDMRLDTNRYNNINVENANGVVVRNNTIQNTAPSTSAMGIHLGSAKNIKIHDNVITGMSGGCCGNGIYVYTSDLVEIFNNSVLNTTGSPNSSALFISGSTNVTAMGNRLLNGAVAGDVGINVFGGPGISCINNVIARYTTPISNCGFTSGNIIVP